MSSSDPDAFETELDTYRDRVSKPLIRLFRAYGFDDLALCLRLVVAITNYERGDNPGSTIITV